MSKGKFIVFEGIDGCGKSTLLREVAGLLVTRNIPIKQFAFPSRANGVVGALIRDVLDGKATVNEETMLWLFTAEGVEREKAILKAVSEGYVVLCDRHTAISAYVYQAPLHSFATVEVVNQTAGFAAPDFVYIVDVPVKVALDRRAARGKPATALYESTEVAKLEAMRKEYHQVVRDLNGNGWAGQTCAVLIDGTQSVSALARQITEEILTTEIVP